MSTVGAAQNIVIDSRSIVFEDRRGIDLPQANVRPPTAVTVHTNVQPLA